MANDILDRIEGKHRIPITDGLVPIGGEGGPAIGPAQSIIGAMIDAAVDVIEDIEGGRGNG